MLFRSKTVSIEQNDIRLLNFFNKIHARYFALIAIQNTYFFTHSLFSCQGTEKIKENRLHSHALKSSGFSTDITQFTQLNSPSENYSSKWKRGELQIQVGEMSASPDGKPIIFFTHDKQAL